LSEPKIPKRIEAIPALKKAFAALIGFYVKPEVTPKTALEMRKKLKAILTSNPVVQKLIKELLAKTIFLSSKNESLRPTQESLLEFVVNIDQLAVSLEPPPEDEEDEDGNILDKSDLGYFDRKDREAKKGDYEEPDEPGQDREGDADDNRESKIYQPHPEDFEDKPEEPDEED